MGTIENTTYKVDKLGLAALQKAYTDFIRFTEETQDIVIYHTLDEFIEVSNTNKWEYLEDGSFSH